MVGRIESTFVFSISVFVMAVTAPISAQAQTAFVLGGGYARDCFLAVKQGAPIRGARALCDRALETEALSIQDLAATHVNRGILAVREERGDVALRDFDAALRQDPGLAPAFLNRAGAYLLLGRWLEAKIDADTALRIGLKEDEWAAHFNRGVALERLGQVNDAYAAFQRSAALAPTRAEVQTELARFTVTRSGATSR